jgi:FkbM family methyltransferase
MNLKSFVKFAQLVGQVRNPLPVLKDRQGLQSQPYTVRFWNGMEVAMRPRRGDLTAFRETWLQHVYLGAGQRLATGDSVIDVGANIGCFTLFASQTVGPSGRVFSIEPDAETFGHLERNIQANRLGNVTALRAALARSPGSVQMQSCGNSLFSSLYAEVDGRRNEGQVQEVPAVTIEQILDQAAMQQCDFLKLDCEGAEHEAVHSMSAATAARIKQISMELHQIAGYDSAATIARLHEFGFRSRRCEAVYYFSR